MESKLDKLRRKLEEQSYVNGYYQAQIDELKGESKDEKGIRKSFASYKRRIQQAGSES